MAKPDLVYLLWFIIKIRSIHDLHSKQSYAYMIFSKRSIQLAIVNNNQSVTPGEDRTSPLILDALRFRAKIAIYTPNQSNLSFATVTNLFFFMYI